MNGPLIPATTHTVGATHATLPRSRGGTMSASTACVCPVIPPPAAPCNPRAMMSWALEVTRPHSTDASTNNTTDVWNVRLRP